MASPQLIQGQRIQGLRTVSRPSPAPWIGQGFLLLAGSLGVVLAAAAIALAARRFSVRHTDHVAVMKSLGSSRQQIARLYGGSLLLLGLLATCLGWALGWLIQAVSSACSPSSWGWRPVRWATNLLIGGATALVCLGFFTWPPLERLARVPPMRVLRGCGRRQVQRRGDYALGAISVFGLMCVFRGS